MTLNDLERRNSPYFAFFSRNSTDFPADYISLVEDRPIIIDREFEFYKFFLFLKFNEFNEFFLVEKNSQKNS